MSASTRIQVVVDEAEREAFRRRAAREGLSLSAWLREAGRHRLREDAVGRIGSVAELQAFFAQLPEEEDGREPDWAEHIEVMERSRRHGLDPT